MDSDSFDVVGESTPMAETEAASPVTLTNGFHQREIRRLRNSVSFRLGVLITDVVKRPWMLLILPLAVIHLFYCVGMERLGKRPPPNQSGGRESEKSSRKDCIVLFPTNGVGFGHFTRMYALAKRWKKQSPSTEIVFFTTMPTLHLLYNEGFVTYHLAGRKKYKDVSASQWNTMVEEQLLLVFAQHKPSLFIFDGAYPYRGMLNAVRGHEGLNKIWLRRGTFKKGTNIPVDSIEHFDLLVRPEDSIPMKAGCIEHSVRTVTVPPIVLLDDEDLMSKDDARKRLGLPLGNKVVYVQLGAGRINDINSEVSLTIEALLSHPNITVVLGESMLGERFSIDLDNVILLRDYPNSIYFKSFDATVQAGGYNSYHEVRKFGLPTIFYPNMETGMDDQLARCKQSEQEGWGLVIEKRTKQEIIKAVEYILKMKRNTVPQEINGAHVL